MATLHIDNINPELIENYLLIPLAEKEKITQFIENFLKQQLKPKSTQKILDDFYNLPASEIETIETPSVYKGKPLSLNDMEQAIEYEAGLHK